jgi:hypothetical protein
MTLLALPLRVAPLAEAAYSEPTGPGHPAAVPRRLRHTVPVKCTIVQSADYAPYITAFIGFAVAAGAYFSKNYIFDPMRSFRAVCWRADAELNFYQNVLCNNVETKITDQALSAMRQLSVDLKVGYKQVPQFIRRIARKTKAFQIPKAESMAEVCSELIGISNRTPDADNSEPVAKIRVLLLTEAPPPARS